VKHCIKAVWERQIVPQDHDEVCDICKNMVAQARDTLQSNETQEELKEVFDGSCDLIPVKIIAKECRAIADQFVPELVETLSSEMNPDTVCTVAGLCNSARIDKLLAINKVPDTSCSSCKNELSKVTQQFDQLSDEQIEMKMFEMCGYLGSYSDSCMYTVSTQLQEIVNFLRSVDVSSLCENDGNCVAPAAFTASANDDLECEFCSKVVKHWIDVYASNSSLEEFRQVLDGLCEKLDSKNADHCKHIVDDYYIPMFEFVRTLDPHMLCSFVGLCGNKGFFEADPSIPINTLLAPSPPVQVVAMTPLIPAQRVEQQDSVTEKPTCVLCEFVMTKLESYLKDGQTVDEIKKYVEEICEELPGSIRGQCKTFVDTYEPLIVQMLAAEIDPSEICKEMNLCDREQMKSAALVSKTASCETCQFVMDEVFSVLSTKDDQQMVINVLESICYRMPASIDQPCEQFVDKYTPIILDLISTSLTPDEICGALDLCDGDKAFVVEPPQVPESLKDTGCVLCEYVISNLDKMLSDKETEAEIKDALETVCSYMPGNIESQCDQFVETYTDLIIQMLTGEVTPQEVCSYLGLCKQSQPSYAVALNSEVSKGPYCTLCEYAVTTLDNMLENESTEEEIEQALDVVCYQLSAPVHKECLKMVHKYTDEIIHMLVHDYSAEDVCSALSLCVNEEISSNDINALDDFLGSVEDEDSLQEGESVGCVMCEFAVSVLDEHLDDDSTIDQVERVVQFLCSYLPGSIADECTDFVDQNGKKLIDALVKDDLDPQEVCTIELNLCSGSKKDIASVGAAPCEFGPELWCSTPFHAKICKAEAFCQATAWRLQKTYNNF